MLKTSQANKYSWISFFVLLFIHVLLVVGIFVGDLLIEEIPAISVLYTIAVFYCWVYKKRWITMVTALVCTLLILITVGLSINPLKPDDLDPISAVLSILPLWLITGLIMFSTKAMDALEMARINQHLKVRNKTIQFKKLEKEFHEMLDSMVKSSVMRLSKKGIVETWPKSAEVATGYKAEEIIGQSYEIFFPKGDRELQLPQKFLAHALFNNKSLAEGWIVTKAGGRFWAAASLFAMKDQLGYVSGFTLVVHDLSYRLKNEELKRQNAVLESRRKEMGQFVFVASHDLKEPLRNLKSIALTLDRKLDVAGKDPLIAQLISYLKSESERAEDLITGLTEYANPGWNQNVEQINLAEMVALVITQVNRQFHKTEVKVIGLDTLPHVEAPKAEIKTLFNQLITNAFKFGAVDNILTLSFSSKTLGDKWVIGISDNGQGIVEDAREKIFAPFQIANKSRKNKLGRGLGLAICKKIVENMFGEIWLDSTYNEGCKIVFSLPVNLKSIYAFNEDNAGR
ncbi:sensor histidine kinase [Luteibaculum oceani]|uniref:histidine kinase n=1 Tax=Luteibaculum oceani TaxID=1294296 RepID=A0A5C6US92_9FLAO|nr:ATP-binding protein [Luteibaculum oceani]TXC76202.1 PAS domain S-box protein [Luteibaculum oceani]